MIMQVNNSKPNFIETYSREKKVFRIINKIERRGLRFDWQKAQRKNLIIKKKIKSVLSKVESINPNSPAQVLAHLQSLGLPDKLLMKKGKLTTEEKTLRRAISKTKNKKAAKFIESILEYRSLSKISGTYLEPLIKRAKANDGIVYCQINPTDSRTGRMASRNPNLQNQPEVKNRRTGRTNPVRECFICREGFANYYFDFKQMEMGIFGLYAEDDRIIKAYQNDEDIHEYMAKQIWPQYDKDPKYWRGVTKNINFGVIYGMGIRTMSLMYEMEEAKARKYYRIYMNEFTSINRFQNECKQRLELDSCVWDWFGRRYTIPRGESYKAVNALVQGSCAQIFKAALINVDKFLEFASFGNHILLPVHDEIQIESICFDNKYATRLFCNDVIEKMTDIPQLAERGFKLKVSVERSLTNWAKKEELVI